MQAPANNSAEHKAPTESFGDSTQHTTAPVVCEFWGVNLTDSFFRRCQQEHLLIQPALQVFLL